MGFMAPIIGGVGGALLGGSVAPALGLAATTGSIIGGGLGTALGSSIAQPDPPSFPSFGSQTVSPSAQAAANIDVARQQSIFNNPNIITPYGNRSVTFDPTTGQPTITEALTPEQQALHQRSLGLAGQQMDLNQALLGISNELEPSVFRGNLQATLGNQQLGVKRREIADALMDMGRAKIPQAWQAMSQPFYAPNTNYDIWGPSTPFFGPATTWREVVPGLQAGPQLAETLNRYSPFGAIRPTGLTGASPSWLSLYGSRP